MSSNGYFEDEEGDIVRLVSPADNDGHDRSGWVNCGAFSVQLQTNQDGDLLVEVHPRGNESPRTVMGALSFTHQQALDAGGKDFEREDG